MSIAPARSVPVALASLTFIAAACGGGSSDPVPATASPDAMPLPHYVAAILEIERDAVDGRTDPPVSARLQAAYNYDLAERFRTSLESLDRLSPPTEALPHAALYREYAEFGADTFTTAAESWLSGSPPDDGPEQGAELARLSEGLGGLFRPLLEGALAGIDGAAAAYLAQTLELRDDFSAAYTEAVTALTAIEEQEDLANRLADGAEGFAGHLAAWEALEPPAGAADVHGAQRSLIATIADIFSDLVEPVRTSGKQATDLVSDRMSEFLRDVADTTAAWNELLIATLRGS
jgi:hypothetical protein